MIVKDIIKKMKKNFLSLCILTLIFLIGIVSAVYVDEAYLISTGARAELGTGQGI